MYRGSRARANARAYAQVAAGLRTKFANRMYPLPANPHTTRTATTASAAYPVHSCQVRAPLRVSHAATSNATAPEPALLTPEAGIGQPDGRAALQTQFTPIGE